MIGAHQAHMVRTDRGLTEVQKCSREASKDPDDMDVLHVQVASLGALRFESSVADAAAAAMAPDREFL